MKKKSKVGLGIFSALVIREVIAVTTGKLDLWILNWL
jgi:hypothetical protein